jgi:uncharacterized membrane protein YidH (DUF202 family)
MACVAIVSLLLILVAYRSFERTISDALAWIIRQRRNFVLFLGIILVIPVVLILL